MNTVNSILISLLITGLATGLLYVFLFYILRPIFRQFERDIALVTLGVSAYPALIVFAIFSLKITFKNLVSVKIPTGIEHILTSIIIIVISYWSVQLFLQVFIYYLKDYTQKTEVMWDDVLLPILSAVVPVLIFLTGGALVLGTFGVNLSGIWVTLGGATFVLGFALQDILANFFSGIVLLIDTPFQFGDILLLEDGSIGMLRRIGVRVTQLYIFSTHCDVYIPNSVLQGQKLTNLSRPTSLYYIAMDIEIPPESNIDETRKLIEEIVLAHADTLGDIDTKLETIDKYYSYEGCDPNLTQQQKIGKSRLLVEQAVNLQLEEIEQALEALVVTMQFAEKGGITEEEIENVKQEYHAILELMGFQVMNETNNNRNGFDLQENNEEGLVELIREWYRIWLKDPNLLDRDQYFISEEWERKINVLKRRAQRLYQKISNPQGEETRLDDYVMELIKWLKEKLKLSREKWQEPQIRMIGINHNEVSYFIGLELAFFVDDIKLEDGKRGDRVRSQLYQEIFRHLKSTYLTWNGIQENETKGDTGNGADVATNPNLVQTALDPATAKQGFAFYLSVGKNKPAIKAGRPFEG
ncbi:mechanosensitive ion channel family protein [Argonema galeatum]|uniref:mechanosensitive ion channel family protein n=1 Tax=Argonema galeatum TaxID=2942762 RepID=UPI0020133796|nr:mechanosensitive ion channel family protein [Argonema galeatum]MCL1462963.1 mechanosensitive ion channel [Argonema galeatum A003/A1]